MPIQQLGLFAAAAIVWTVAMSKLQDEYVQSKFHHCLTRKVIILKSRLPNHS